MKPPIIDALTRISTGPDDVIGWGPRFLAEDLLALMDTPRKLLGKTATVDKSIVFPSLALTVPTSTLSFEEQHAYVAESVVKHRDRLIGGIALQPRLWNDQVAGTVRTMVREGGFRMIYLNPSLYKFWLPIKTPSESAGSRKLLYPIFEAARELDVPIYIHTGEQPYALPATADFIAGALAGVGGAFLTLSHTNLFIEGLVAGRGFIALAVVVFGRWKPWGVFGASLLFGVFYALQLSLQAMTRTAIPYQFWQALPYVATLIVLVVLRGRAGAPRALGVPYNAR